MWTYKPATKYRAEAFSIWIAHCEFLLSGAFNWITPIWKGFSLRTFMFSFHHQHLAWDRKCKEKNVAAKGRLKYQGMTLDHLRSWAGPLKSFFCCCCCRVYLGVFLREVKVKEKQMISLSWLFFQMHLILFLCPHFPTLTSCLMVIKPSNQI